MKNAPLDSTDLTWLTGLARALLGESHAADDLVQETAVAALEGSLPPGEPRRAWLGSVARRLAARRFRGDARRERREEVAARAEALPDSAELVEKAEVAEHVTAAARRLPEPFRRTILLRFLEGMTPEEIAREEGSPADTVRWRVRRGLELLREELVRRHDRDWSSWCVLLLPLARSRGSIGKATAGAAGVSSGTVASVTAMKVTMAVAAAVGCVGLWLAWQAGSAGADDLGGDGLSAAAEPAAVAPGSGDGPEPEPVELTTARAEVPSATESEDAGTVADVASGDLVGDVVDEDGAPVAGAQVFLVPSVAAGSEGSASGEVHTRTTSDGRGAFRIAREDWLPASGESDVARDLGVVANGFRRRFVLDVTGDRPDGRLVVVLERGRTLVGRIVDELGWPVAGLELLAHTASAGVDHVSPSQRRLRAQRRAMGDASSTYDQCLATTDASGEVVFTGLPPGDLSILPLDAGWTIESSNLVGENESYAEWTAKRRLGVRLIVTDANTGQPVERAAATFEFDLTFDDGGTADLGQWVGRGVSEVTYVLGDEGLWGYEDRTITRAVFYGTVRSGDGAKVDWRAAPIEDATEALGVVDVRVEVDPTPVLELEVAAADEEAGEPEELETTTLEIDARYEDASSYEGELTVQWFLRDDPSRDGESVVQPASLGRYRLEVPVGDLDLVVYDRFASGSLPYWTGEARCEAGLTAIAYVTLQRGATATITRPEGWSGSWGVRATWRLEGTEEWQGGLGYGTDEATLRLPAMRPAEWRFEIRRFEGDPDPIVRIVTLAEGDLTTVNG